MGFSLLSTRRCAHSNVSFCVFLHAFPALAILGQHRFTTHIYCIFRRQLWWGVLYTVCRVAGNFPNRYAAFPWTMLSSSACFTGRGECVAGTAQTRAGAAAGRSSRNSVGRPLPGRFIGSACAVALQQGWVGVSRKKANAAGSKGRTTKWSAVKAVKFRHWFVRLFASLAVLFYGSEV